MEKNYKDFGEKGNLIITRRIGESVVIGDNAEIEITLLNVFESSARISVRASRDIPVHRREIYERIKQKEAESNVI